MNKKTIIEVVVIVGAFAASAIVLYNGLIKGGTSADSMAVTNAAPPEKILPYGDRFNYEIVQNMRERDFQFGIVSYPVLDPASEVSKDPSQLITPAQGN